MEARAKTGRAKAKGTECAGMVELKDTARVNAHPKENYTVELTRQAKELRLHARAKGNTKAKTIGEELVGKAKAKVEARKV